MEGSKMWNILKVGFNYYKKNFKTISLLVLCFYVVFFVYFKLFVINSDFEEEFNGVRSNKFFQGIKEEVKSNSIEDIEKKRIFGKFYGIAVSNNTIEKIEKKYKDGEEEEEEEEGNEDESNEIGDIFEKEEINKNASNVEKEKDSSKANTKSEFNDFEDEELVEKKEKKDIINENKYIVSNSKCRLLDQNPWDKSIKKYIESREFEPCASTDPLLSSIRREKDGNFSIVINEKIADEYYNNFINCCWSSITKIQSKKPSVDYDIKFNVSECKNFKDHVQLPAGVELVKVVCKSFENFSKKIFTTDYENIHVILNSTKVENQFKDGTLKDKNDNKKVSVLVLGIDSLSRLNFIRSFPKTQQFLHKTGWTSLEGYNKIGEDTYSNLMAVLSGLNVSSSNAYKSEGQRFLDDYPFIWKDFKNAGYVTTFGEDKGNLSMFNFEKTGFVDPPTDYYLRPYIVATEKLLKTKYKYDNEYCTGPELAFDRIFNYALDFAVTFSSRPYFGFFWTNSVTHYDINAASSMDTHLLKKLEFLEQHGVFNNTLVILLSDHGMRWGEFRNTSVGWYEDRLPFVYLRVPESFENLDNNYNYNTLEIIQALKVNERRLTSPYDLHETLKDILEHAGGKSTYKSDCPSCQSLFKPVPYERGCEDIGVSPHWCACSEFNPQSSMSEIAVRGALKFLSYIEDIIKDYKNEDGRLCAKLKLKKIHRFDEIHLKNDTTGIKKFFYKIEATPGNAVYEFTMNLDENEVFGVSEHEISRIDSYKNTTVCLPVISHRKYCYCSNLIV